MLVSFSGARHFPNISDHVWATRVRTFVTLLPRKAWRSIYNNQAGLTNLSPRLSAETM